MANPPPGVASSAPDVSPPDSNPQSNALPAGNSLEQIYIHLTARAMQAQKPEDLKFTIVNETLQLLPYRQAAFFNARVNGSLYLASASGLASVAESSPYTVWLNRLATTLDTRLPIQTLAYNDASLEHRDGWQEWLPDHLLVGTLKTADQRLLGLTLFARESPWTEAEISQASHLHRNYAYCLAALGHNSNGIRQWFAKTGVSRFALLTLLILIGLMFVPIRLSTLASAEVVALNAFSVAAPQDGVVNSFWVQPNAPVKKGDVLFTLDDTSIINRYEVANKALAIARADALSAEQRAFDDIRAKAALAASIGRVREKEAELASIKALMARVEIRAERDGIAIFADANDWIGRPVQTGERVIQLADPKDAGLLMWLPVKDALNIEAGAQVKVFLHTRPLEPISAKILQTSYQASMSPDGVASYRLKGKFEAPAGTAGIDLPRIGLRGTARLSGEWSSLGYYLFRRPIAALREWAGY